ncbi:MAG: hypothetical protein JWO82_3176, partial [Akkermansiaceae bacterium]|nr:hypothetical protein [Akkermansiaceae bacterium]
MKTLLRPVSGPLALLSLSLTLALTLTSGVLAAPSITSTKDDATAAATRKVAGNNIDYTIQISNAAGATDALGVTLTDPTPANTTLVAASVNVSPLAFDDAYAAVGNTQLRVGNPAAMAGPATSSATKVTANDMEFLGDTFAISSFQATSAQGGTVAMVTTGADAGSFSYLPPAGFEGTDTFTYTITDDGSEGFGALTNTATVTITVSEVVWYVDDSAAGGGTGRSNAPLQNLSTLNVAATDPDEADDYIFVYSGNYSGAFTLEAGQRLIGEPAGLTVGGLAIAAGGTRPVFSHNAGTLLTLSTNNTVRGINFTNTAGNGISGSAVGTLTLSDFDVTVTGGTALNLTTSGAVTATGADNDLTSTNGTALIVANVGIGAANLTFKSISAGSAAGSAGVGISLNTTGNAGHLTVTGTGTAASGGTIQHKTGTDGSTTSGIGIYLNSTNSPSFDRMQLNDFANYGIFGSAVTGFTLTNSIINGTNGTLQGGIGEGDVYFTGLSGSATVSNSTFTGAAYDVFHVFNNGETLNRLTITGCTFTMSNTSGNDALAFQATGGTFNATVQSSTMNAARGDLFQLNLLGTVTSDLVFGGATNALGNTLTNSNANIVSGGGGVTIGGGGPSNNITLTYNISHNTMKGSHGAVLAISKGTGTGASLIGTIDGNVIGTQGVAASGSTQGEGIAVYHDGAGFSGTTITNNHVSGVVAGRGAIDLLLKNGAAGQMSAVIQGNTIDTLDQVNSFTGIYVQTGSLTGAGGDNNKSGLTIGGAGALANHTDIGANSSGALVAGITVEQEGVSRVGLLGSPNYSGAPYDFTAVQNYIAARNGFTGSNGQSVFAFA